jgi:hypothetical protein
VAVKVALPQGLQVDIRALLSIDFSYSRLFLETPAMAAKFGLIDVWTHTESVSSNLKSHRKNLHFCYERQPATLLSSLVQSAIFSLRRTHF